MRLRIGQEIPNFRFNTISGKDIDYLLSKKGRKSVLLFLRYYGCRICQLDLWDLQDNIDQFIKKDIDIKVVLQSDPEKMKNSLVENPFDYEILCDPEYKLYKKFDIRAADTVEELSGGNTVEKISRAKEAGLEHGEYEGMELQLPAIFIVDEDDKIIYSHYGKNAADIPSANEILEITLGL